MYLSSFLRLILFFILFFFFKAGYIGTALDFEDYEVTESYLVYGVVPEMKERQVSDLLRSKAAIFVNPVLPAPRYPLVPFVARFPVKEGFEEVHLHGDVPDPRVGFHPQAFPRPNGPGFVDPRNAAMHGRARGGLRGGRQRGGRVPVTTAL